MEFILLSRGLPDKTVVVIYNAYRRKYNLKKCYLIKGGISIPGEFTLKAFTHACLP
jgi:hypothetical protein